MDLLLKKEVRCAWSKPLFLEVLQHLPVGLSTMPTQSYSRLGPRMNRTQLASEASPKTGQ